MLAASSSKPRVGAGHSEFLAVVDRYGCAMDGAAAADSTPDVEQQHVCFLFQKVFLRRLDDDPGRVCDPPVYTQKRRQRC